MTTLTKERIEDIIGTIENHIAEPNEDWWDVLKSDATNVLLVLREKAKALELVEKWMLFYYYDKETDEIERSQEAAEALAVLTAMVEENERLRVLTDLSHLADMLKELNEVKAELATRKEIMAEDFLEITRLKAELLAAQAVNAKNGAVIIEQVAELAQLKAIVDEEYALVDGDERFHYPPANTDINAPLALVQCHMEGRMCILTKLRAALKCRETKP